MGTSRPSVGDKYVGRRAGSLPGIVPRSRRKSTRSNSNVLPPALGLQSWPSRLAGCNRRPDEMGQSPARIPVFTISCPTVGVRCGNCRRCALARLAFSNGQIGLKTLLEDKYETGQI